MSAQLIVQGTNSTWQAVLQSVHLCMTGVLNVSQLSTNAVAGSAGGGSHSVLASAKEPATLAHSYITDRGSFKPAPQPPRKAPTAPKNPVPAPFTQLGEEEVETEIRSSFDRYGYGDVAHEECSSQSTAEAEHDAEVQNVLQQWFKEQKHFQQNVALRRQHAHLSRQIAQLLTQKHLANKGSKRGVSTKATAL